MKVTYNWLKDYVKIKLSPQALADKLTMAGLEVVSLERFEDDWVLEVEVTTNRPDWLSVIGIAHEVAALTGKKLRLTQIKQTKYQTSDTRLPFKIKIEDKRGCLRYIGRIIDNIEIKLSPFWMQKRLTAVGLRPINNIVDITNYVLWETGQPLHAFDYRKIEEGIIIVRRAKDGENIITIDGEKRQLDSSILVIADKTKPLAIAGIMGGKESEVNASTQTLLLESAYFDPLIIRSASQKLGLITESSYRFERKVALETVFQASLRALELIENLALPPRGKVLVSKIKDIGIRKKEAKKISLNIGKVRDILGEKPPLVEIEKILKSLCFSVRKKKDSFEIKPPLFRRDIEREEDLIEEIARLYGYEKFPLTLPAPGRVSEIEREEHLVEIKKTIYETLIGLGLDEVITYALVGRDLLKKINFYDEASWIRVSNPLSRGQELLRPTLIASLLEVVAHNFKHPREGLRIFEWGKIYLRREERPEEYPYLGIALSGESPSDWLNKGNAFSFYDLKGMIEKLFAQLGIKEVNFLEKEKNPFEPGHCAEMKIEEETLGFLGKIKDEVQKKFDLVNEVFVAEIDLRKLAFFILFEKRYQPLPKYPFVLRDISFLVEEKIPYQRIEQFFQKIHPDLIKEFELIDFYTGGNIPPAKKSFTVSLKFQSFQRTLLEEEVEERMREIRRALKEEFGAELR